jgi:hypothetical protein
MAGAVGVLAVVLAHAAPPYASAHPHAAPRPHAAAPRWGLRAPAAESFYSPSGLHWINNDVRAVSPPRPVFNGAPPRSSIRDAVTRYSEERGGFVAQPARPAMRENSPPPIIPPAQRRN